MNKKVVASAILLVLILILLVVFRVVRLPFFPIHPHQAIPNNTALFFDVKTQDLDNLAATTLPLAKLLLPKNLGASIGLLKEVLGNGAPLPTDENWCIVVNPTQKIGADMLFIIPGLGGVDKEGLGKAAGWRSRTYRFDNQSLVNLKKDGKECSIATYHNLLLFAEHAYLVEDALSQLHQPSSSICGKKGFKNVFKQQSHQDSTASMFVNFENLNAQFAPFLNASKFEELGKIGHIGQWGLIEIPLTGNPSSWKGAFVPATGNPLFAAAKNAGAGLSEKIWEAIPDNLSALFAMSVDGLLPDHFFQGQGAWAGNELAHAIGEPLGTDQPEQFLLIGSNDAKLAETALQNAGGGAPVSEYQIFKIWKIENANSNGFFGTDPTFATSTDGYVLIGNNLSGMDRWLGKYIAGQTLAKDLGFLTLKKELPNGAGLVFYMDGIKGWQQVVPFLNERLVASFGRNPIPFERMAGALKWKAGAGQTTFVQSGGLEQENQPASILWNAPLQANAAIRPVVSRDPQNGEMDVLITDVENRVYLLSHSGRVLWRKQMPERILSEIFPIDLDNDRQRQFAFSTQSAIYVIDRNGENVEGFPLELSVPASNGVTVVDFFQSNDYNFFIACANGKAYGFDEKGSPIEGWRPKEGIGYIEKPILHFQAEGKDFLALLENTGKMRVFKKNGTDRFSSVKFDSPDLQPLDYQVSKISSRIVTADGKGKIFVTNLSGDHFGLQLKVGKNEEVKFLFADVVGDDRKDYIALSGNEMVVSFYEEDKFEKAFAHEFPWPQDEVFEVKWERRPKAFIGTVNRSKRQLFLMDGNGRIPDQFPLAGSTPFIVADLAGDGKPVVIAGNGPGVVAYVLE